LPQVEPGLNNESAVPVFQETPSLVESVVPSPGRQDAVETPETPETSEPDPAQPTAEQVAAVKPAEPETAAQETVGPALIQMRFSEDSWVEMEAHGRKLVVGTQYAGSERTVRAKPPIQILLGNAPGVEIVYRGEVVDISPYQRGKVARLTLED